MFNDNIIKIAIKYVLSYLMYIVIITKNNQLLNHYTIDYLDFKIIETIITN